MNGRTVTELGTKVDPAGDVVTHRGEKLALKEQHTYILLNKPAGYLTTTRDERGRRTVLDLLPPVLREKRLFPVGRLDKETTGLLLLTDDGELSNHLMHPRNQIEKRYEVKISKPIEKEHVERLITGIRDAGDVLKAKAATMITPTKLEVVLTEGRKREIRRMLAGLGYTVSGIKRTHYAFLAAEDLKEGTCRTLSQQEIAKLKAL